MKNYTNATDKEKSDFHYKIYCARKDKGMFVFDTLYIYDHSLIGQKFTHEKNKVVTILKVYIHWYWGLYRLTFLYEDENQSGGTRVIAKWKQEYNVDSLIRKAKTITSIDRILMFEEEI